MTPLPTQLSPDAAGSAGDLVAGGFPRFFRKEGRLKARQLGSVGVFACQFSINKTHHAYE
jgi:hypothetical protein